MATTCDKDAGQKSASALGLVSILTHQKLERVPTGTRSGVYQVNNGFDPVGDHLVGMRPGNVVAKAFRAGFGLAVLLCDPTRQSPGSFNTAHTESPAALNGVSTHLRTMS